MKTHHFVVLAVILLISAPLAERQFLWKKEVEHLKEVAEKKYGRDYIEAMEKLELGIFDMFQIDENCRRPYICVSKNNINFNKKNIIIDFKNSKKYELFNEDCQDCEDFQGLKIKEVGDKYKNKLEEGYRNNDCFSADSYYQNKICMLTINNKDKELSRSILTIYMERPKTYILKYFFDHNYEEVYSDGYNFKIGERKIFDVAGERTLEIDL